MANKAFIFDWSGTLNNNFHLFCKVCDLIFVELGRKPISLDEIKLNVTSPYMKFWNKYFPDLTMEEQCDLYEKYIHQAGESELYQKVDEIITYLNEKGYKIFILSSDPTSKLLPEIKKSGFAKLITKTVGDIHDKKDAIITFVNDFALNKNFTFCVGDTSGDIEVGKFAEVNTIGISWGFQHKNVLSGSKPYFLIDDIIEIRDIIEKI